MDTPADLATSAIVILRSRRRFTTYFRSLNKLLPVRLSTSSRLSSLGASFGMICSPTNSNEASLLENSPNPDDFHQ
jgi:hypothetical protein